LINPYRFRKPLAPSVAAEIEGVNFKKKVVLDAYKKLAKKYEIIIVEGAGGIMVPLYKRYLFLDMVKDLNLPLMIVARPGLGTINHSLLTIEAARKKGIKVLGVVFNNVEKPKRDVSSKTNPEIIAQIGKVSVLGILPHLTKSDNNIFKIIATKLINQLN
jgi:dethiobiotin synthetase